MILEVFSGLKDSVIQFMCKLIWREFKALRVQSWCLAASQCVLLPLLVWDTGLVGWDLLCNSRLSPFQRRVLDLLRGRAAGADEADWHHGGSQEIRMGRADTGFGSLSECSGAGTFVCQGSSAGKTKGGTFVSFCFLVGVSSVFYRLESGNQE